VGPLARVRLSQIHLGRPSRTALDKTSAFRQASWTRRSPRSLRERWTCGQDLDRASERPSCHRTVHGIHRVAAPRKNWESRGDGESILRATTFGSVHQTPARDASDGGAPHRSCLGRRENHRPLRRRSRSCSCMSSGSASRRKNSNEQSRKSSGRSRRSSTSGASASPKGGVRKEKIPNSQFAGHAGGEGTLFVCQKLDRLRAAN
jgi:hypothetical protein